MNCLQLRRQATESKKENNGTLTALFQEEANMSPTSTYAHMDEITDNSEVMFPVSSL